MAQTQIAVPADRTRRQKGPRPANAKISPYVYFVPIALMLIVVYVFPLVFTIWPAIHDTTFFTIGKFSGLDSIESMFTDSRLLTNVRNTIVYTTGSVALAFPAGFVAALVLQRIQRLKRLARALLLLPWLMSQATVGLIWMWFLNPDYGPMPYLLKQSGFGSFAVFSDPKTAMPVLIFITAWWSYPQAMIFFVGALQMIPGELRESIEIDGGGAWTSFRYITVPFLRNSAVTVVLVLFMLYLQMVTIMLVTTRGGPLRSTETLSMRIYNQLFTDFHLSDAAASALLLFAINIVLTVVIIPFRNREDVL